MAFYVPSQIFLWKSRKATVTGMTVMTRKTGVTVTTVMLGIA